MPLDSDRYSFKNVLSFGFVFFLILWSLELVTLLDANFSLLTGVRQFFPPIPYLVGRVGFVSIILFLAIFWKERKLKKIGKYEYAFNLFMILFVFLLAIRLDVIIRDPKYKLYANACLLVSTFLCFHRAKEVFWFLQLHVKVPVPELDFRYPLDEKPSDGIEGMGFSFRAKAEKNGYLNIEYPQQGMMVMGGAGAGKTFSTLNPILRVLPKKGYTGFVYDFKFPEQTTILYRAWMKCKGQKPNIFIINFVDPLHSHQGNPIRPENLENKTYIQEYSETLLKNLNPDWIKKPDFWYAESMNMVVAAMNFLKEYEPQFCTLPHLTSLILADLDRSIQLLCNDPDAYEEINSIKSALDKKAEGQISGVQASVQGPFKKINTPNIFWTLSGDDFDFDLNEPDDPKLLVVGNSSGLTGALGPVISLFAAVAMKKLNRQGKEKSTLFADEIQSLFIPKLEELPATGRSNKVATILACQDISQLVLKWGREATDALIANMGTQLYGMVNHVETAKKCCEIFGQDDFVKSSHSYSDHDSVSISTQRQHIVEPTMVMRQKRGHFMGKTSTGELFSCNIIAHGDKDNTDLPVVNRLLEKLSPNEQKDVIERNFRKVKDEVENLFIKYEKKKKEEILKIIELARNGDTDQLEDHVNRKLIVLKIKKDNLGIDFQASYVLTKENYRFTFAELDLTLNDLQNL